MRVSKFYLSTLKEAPAEAEVVSQQLMLRAGMIKRLAAGIYTWMPLGLMRVLRKVEAIVREEMNRAGALELADAASSSRPSCGRRRAAGTSSARSCCGSRTATSATSSFGPTHEEVITDIVRKDIRSYRQLPLNLYQIQTKFRDEIRPRFGVMRAREFIMKDAYSFDVDKRRACCKSYQAMYDAYARIFTRLGLKFRAVEADTGAIGGIASHEFQVLADSGEDAIAYCPASDYAANVELAEALAPRAPRAGAGRADAEGAHARASPPARTSRSCSACRSTRTVKCLHGLRAGRRVQMLLVRGDHMGNEVKIGKLPGLDGWRWATDAEIVAATGCRPGYLGPGRHPGGHAADRRPHGRRDGRLRLRRQRSRLPPARRQFRPRLPRAGHRRRHPQRGRGRPVARRQGHARRSCAASRSATSSRWATCIRRRWAQLISTPAVSRRSWRWAATASASPASWPPPSSRTTTTGASSGREPLAPFTVAIAPIGYDRSEAVTALADRLHDELDGGRASRCCSTTAASVLA